jgi:hypothetical protein
MHRVIRIEEMDDVRCIEPMVGILGRVGQPAPGPLPRFGGQDVERIWGGSAQVDSKGRTCIAAAYDCNAFQRNPPYSDGIALMLETFAASGEIIKSPTI